jgi:hypothetical protein
MGTYSPDPEIAELRQRWLARERRARAANASFAVGEGGDFVEPTYAYDSPEDLAARHAAIIRQIEEHRRRVGDAATSPSEVWDAGAEFGPADRSALAGAASWASQFGTDAQRRFSAAAAFAIARAHLHEHRHSAAIRIAAAAPEIVRNTFRADYQYFHASLPPNVEWPSDRALRAGALRSPGDGLASGLSTPAVDALASRLERAGRVNECRRITREMLICLHDRGPCVVHPDVRVRGITVDFVVCSWKGVFLIWSVDHRWTAKQAAMVMPVREQIQRDLGDNWPGQVEAVFHSPRERTGWDRRVMVDDESAQPIDIVIMGGRIDQLLEDWRPLGEVGIDPEWLRWISQASEPRWWRSEEGRRDLPAPPPHEQL